MSRKIDWQKTGPIREGNPKIVAAWAFSSAQDVMAQWQMALEKYGLSS